MGLGGCGRGLLYPFIFLSMECDLEYLAGVVKGDGTLYYNKRAREYVVEIYDRDVEYVAVLADMLRACRLNPHVKSYGSYYRVRVNSREFYELIGEAVERLLQSPTVSFVRGLFDSDGTLYFDRRKRRPYPVVELGNSDPRVVDAAGVVLSSLGVRYGVKNYGGRFFKLVVRGSNAVLFARLVKPLHPVKFSPLFSLAPSSPPPRPAH